MAYKPFDLTDKVSVVTGGNAGIGFGMAEALGQAGAAVCIWGRDAAKNAAAVKRLHEQDIVAAAEVCDVSIEAQVEEAFARTLSLFGRVDACFANAGADGQSPFLEMTTMEWQRVLGANLDATFFTFRAAAQHMVDRGGGGSLVATSSITALTGRAQREHYVSAKAAVIGLVKSLSRELGAHRIRVNAIVPGPTSTEMYALALNPNEKAPVLHRGSLGRVAVPSEFGGLAIYLASDASSYHTGDTLVCDGGFSTG